MESITYLKKMWGCDAHCFQKIKKISTSSRTKFLGLMIKLTPIEMHPVNPLVPNKSVSHALRIKKSGHKQPTS